MTDPWTLVRTGDPDTSHEAAYSVDTKTWERRVLAVIKSFGTAGCIQDDVISKIQKLFGLIPYSTVTARFKALEEKRFIEYTGEKRPGISGRPSRVRRYHDDLLE